MTALTIHSTFWLRILAVATLIFAVPIIFLKLPWLPVMAQTFVQTASESTAHGTEGYIKDHGERLWRLVAVLGFYVFGLLAIFGLSGVALGVCKRPAAQRIAWLSALIIGIGLPIFDGVRIEPGTDRGYVFLAIYLPIGITVLSFLALVVLRVGSVRES